jgi:putative membrane protein
MKKLSFLLLTGAFLFQYCNNGNENKKSMDSVNVTNKEAQATINTPDTSIHQESVTTDTKSSAFAIQAANGGMMEVELGRWAQAHSSNTRVKEFGAMMVADHSNANDDLKAVAAAKGISLPGAVDAETKMHIDAMMSKKGRDFDKAYVNMMVEDHQKDVAEFEKASKELPDAELKNFAARTLPVLQKHHSVIKAIKTKL